MSASGRLNLRPTSCRRYWECSAGKNKPTDSQQDIVARLKVQQTPPLISAPVTRASGYSQLISLILRKTIPLLLNPNGGNVGIGTTTPRSSLHIRKDNQGGLGPTLTLMNGAGHEGAQAAIDFHTYWAEDRPLPSGRILCEDDAHASGHFIFQTKQEGAETYVGATEN